MAIALLAGFSLVVLVSCSDNPDPTLSAPRLTPTPPIPPQVSQPGRVWLHPIDEMALVFVPAGPFQMGALENDSIADEGEKPQHEVFLDSYWIDQTEVTNGMYALCVLEGACQELNIGVSITRQDYYTNLSYSEYPVVNVTWEQAKTYCEWAGRRLPTEAEWEKAARGPDGGIYPWGDQPPTCELAGFGNYAPGQGTCIEDIDQVGNYPAGASPYGALDMAGNVWEWVADWYAADFYQTGDSRNPGGPSSGASKVLRGGAFSDGPEIIRSTNRHQTRPENFSYFVGFRCVVSATP